MNIFKEYVSLNTGFFTFGMWVLVGAVKGVFGLYGPYSRIKMKLFVLTAMAATPVIWLIGNRKIGAKLKSRLAFQWRKG